ncbi:uncharacterized protein LOC129616406 [Condylostylus longicornis]|uniref:uncharacterized protein LOC129616406 n=1 Tax=Condylostylus longicornis TaxID=2530218 RepID=UPI00244E5871|nr:uncharacterized protein LOC129616406 [Condylostylus longicornis]
MFDELTPEQKKILLQAWKELDECFKRNNHDIKQLPHTDEERKNYFKDFTEEEWKAFSELKIREGSNLVNVIHQIEKFNKKFGVITKEITFKFKDFDDEKESLFDHLNKCFKKLIMIVTQGRDKQDLIGLKIAIPSMENTKPIGLSFRKIETLDSNSILDLFSSVSQSNTNYMITDLLKISATIVQVPSGKGHQSRKICCIAHNFKSYDGQFIVSELLQRNKPVPIMGGNKILKVTFNHNIIFIDSLNFLPIPLSKFTSAFGLDKNEVKGYYPYLFNTKANYNYVGEIPSTEMFALNNFNSHELEKFYLWYNNLKKSNYVYNYREELIKYCIQDVNVLRQGCLKFMNDYLQLLNINPFFETFTLAQACLTAYQKHFLKENTLGVTPINNYSKKKNQSLIGLMRLEFKNQASCGKIKYEYDLPDCNFTVDGFNPNTNTVYEFLGCFYHGCEDCFFDRNLVVHGYKMQARFENAMCKIAVLKQSGYNVCCEWECAIFGGRTEVFKLYYKIQANEKICYYDFTSLYPYVNKNCKYPILHPKIYNSQECLQFENDISKIDGLIKCAVLPPQNLWLPILPIRANNKMLMVLCRSCAEMENVLYKCTHNDKERMLFGTWTDMELKLSVKYGYTIIEIHEIWHYDCETYDSISKTGGLFTDYMNFFIKYKTEGSGYPTGIQTKSEQDAYIKDFFENEGVMLDKSKIALNPSLRNLAKLKLNSFWGKLIQRNDRHSTTVVQTITQFHNLIHSSGISVSDIFTASEHQVWINWKYNYPELNPVLKNQCLIVGAFTTAHARCLLYNEITKIGKNLLYCDTDSMIFVQHTDNEYDLKTGTLIGDLTNEFTSYGKNVYGTEFVSTGPKSYSYRYYNPDTDKYGEVVKCKGITSNKNGTSLNFEHMKQIVTDPFGSNNLYFVTPNKIKRKKHFHVTSEDEKKKFGFTFTKRACRDNFETIPYGFLNS